MIEFMFCGMLMNYCTRITQKMMKKKVRNERDHLTLTRMCISIFIDYIYPNMNNTYILYCPKSKVEPKYISKLEEPM
jgi:hypothetical protein